MVRFDLSTFLGLALSGLALSEVVPNEYIVKLKSDLDAAAVRAIAAEFPGVEDIWTFAIKGFSGTFDAETLQRLHDNGDVVSIEGNHVVYEASPVVQEDALWGLASLSHEELGENTYVYDESAGEGTFLYLLDTGVRVDHPEFEGRATFPWRADRFWPPNDHSGHGSHVAGTAAGVNVGVAKKASIIGLKVLHSGVNTERRIIAGLDWAVEDITVTHDRAAMTVINLSLGGDFSATFNEAVENVVDMGIMVVAAAGNEGRDVSLVSPASSPKVLTVAAASVEGRRWQQPNNWSSNFGEGIDIWAPGQFIYSADLTPRENYYGTRNGTSMAAPHVTGLALYLKGLDSSLVTPEQTKARILELAIDRGVEDAGPGSPSIWVHNGIFA